MAQPGLRSHRRGQASREEAKRTTRGEASVHSGKAQGEASRREVTWASRLSFDKEKQLKVAMNGLGITDEGAESWSSWFVHHSGKLGRGAMLRAGLVDFSENKLTSAGTAMVLRAFLAARIPVHVLKLHHNLLRDGGPFAEYLRNSDGCLQELHLSHNELDARASAIIVAAAASALGKDGLPCYPRRSGARGLVPLWLRLEKNNIDDGEFSAIVDASLPDKLCSARSKWCTPHCCACKVPPAVHAKNLGNQRENDLVEGPDMQDEEEDTPASDFFTRLLAKSAAKQAAAYSQGPHASSVEGADCEELLEGCERAEVERWDAELGRWVPDFIDIPPRMDELRSSLPKAQQEKLSMGLKALIGIGKASRQDRAQPAGHEAASAVAPKPGSLKTHRRGSQPSSGNVRQAQVPQPPNLMRLLREEGFQIGETPGLNPAAPEFRPQRREPPKAPRAKASAGFDRQASVSFSTASMASGYLEEEAPRGPEVRAVSLLSAGVRERPMKPLKPMKPMHPMKVKIPSECLFGKESLTEARDELSLKQKDEDSQDASSAFLDDEVSTVDAVDTADSTEDASGDAPKSEMDACAASEQKRAVLQC